jgi:hypothetical protein
MVNQGQPDPQAQAVADCKALSYISFSVQAQLALNQHGFNSMYNMLKNFPRELLLRVLRTIMENNTFTFGDTFWLQTQGTAMGTPAAPLYSIIIFGYHENTYILTKFESNLLY